MKSSPTSYASTGLCRCTCGSPGIAPISTSSMLGCVAAVIDTESPSHPRPAVIHTMWTSLTSGGRWVLDPYGAAPSAIGDLLPLQARQRAVTTGRHKADDRWCFQTASKFSSALHRGAEDRNCWDCH